MDYVYVLKSRRDGNLYTGLTANLKRRLIEHNLGKVSSTRYRRPVELIYSEEFRNKKEALEREKYFKTPEGGVLKRGLAGVRPDGRP